VTVAQAHATCLALLLVDFLARTWRMQWLLRGLGYRLPFWEIFVHSALGEAASSLSPFRLGGEPSRIWAMTRLGVPLTPAVVGIGVEIVAMTPVVLAGAALVALYLAPEWWAAAGPALSRHARGGGPWIVGVTIATALAWALAHRAAPAAAAALRREIAAARAHVRELPAWPLLASVPMTALNVGARVAVLPVLVSAMPSQPPLGPVIVGSFALLYSQLVLPTPAGAGAVELGFLGGAAGELGRAETSLLVAWRFYTNGLGVALGVVLTVARYGAPGFTVLMRRLRSGVADVAEPPGHACDSSDVLQPLDAVPATTPPILAVPRQVAASRRRKG
jgi:uncharacterized membrane protein YbhN (UPF0104 family)